VRLVIAAALALACLGSPQAALAQAVEIGLQPGETLLKIEAEGEARSRPDLMEITAGVVTTAKTAREALSSNAALANRLVAAVRASGVEAGDVQTSELAVSPQFAREDRERAEREETTPRITGYVARNRLSLVLRDLRKAPDIIDRLFTAGANEVQGPSFGLKDPKPAREQARRAAVAAAREEADAYADALGMRIARVLRVSQRGGFDTEEAGTIVATGSRIAATPIEPGEIETSVRVWIDYAMVPQ
jgi:hypothetical protein